MVFASFIRNFRLWHFLPISAAWVNFYLVASGFSLHDMNAFLADKRLQKRLLPDDEWYGKYAPNYNVIKAAEFSHLVKET